MNNEINLINDETVRCHLTDLWNTQIQNEVIKSEKILSKKEKWLNDYEKNYGVSSVKMGQHKRRAKSTGKKNDKMLLISHMQMSSPRETVTTTKTCVNMQNNTVFHEYQTKLNVKSQKIGKSR